MRSFVLSLAGLLLLAVTAFAQSGLNVTCVNQGMSGSFYDFTFPLLNGTPVKFNKYQGKVRLSLSLSLSLSLVRSLANNNNLSRTECVDSLTHWAAAAGRVGLQHGKLLRYDRHQLQREQPTLLQIL